MTFHFWIRLLHDSFSLHIYMAQNQFDECKSGLIDASYKAMFQLMLALLVQCWLSNIIDLPSTSQNFDVGVPWKCVFAHLEHNYYYKCMSVLIDASHMCFAYELSIKSVMNQWFHGCKSQSHAQIAACFLVMQHMSIICQREYHILIQWHFCKGDRTVYSRCEKGPSHSPLAKKIWCSFVCCCMVY